MKDEHITEVVKVAKECREILDECIEIVATTKASTSVLEVIKELSKKNPEPKVIEKLTNLTPNKSKYTLLAKLVQLQTKLDALYQAKDPTIDSLQEIVSGIQDAFKAFQKGIFPSRSSKAVRAQISVPSQRANEMIKTVTGIANSTEKNIPVAQWREKLGLDAMTPGHDEVAEQVNRNADEFSKILDNAMHMITSEANPTVLKNAQSKEALFLMDLQNMKIRLAISQKKSGGKVIPGELFHILEQFQLMVKRFFEESRGSAIRPSILSLGESSQSHSSFSVPGGKRDSYLEPSTNRSSISQSSPSSRGEPESRRPSRFSLFGSSAKGKEQAKFLPQTRKQLFEGDNSANKRIEEMKGYLKEIVNPPKQAKNR